MNENQPIQNTFGEELASSITHGIGAILGAAGLVVLVVFATLYGDAWHIVSVSVYGATLVLLYLMSTLYHSLQSPRVKRVFQILDHSSIYLLIAGSYTPFTLVTLRGAWGWSLFGIIWGLAIVGIVLKVFFTGRMRIFSSIVYIAMGWFVLIALRPLLSNFPFEGFIWLLVGGCFYTSGIFFYCWKTMPYSHAIWHLFVLAGSICQYFAILFYVLPLN